jgi:hypothetical protein
VGYTRGYMEINGHTTWGGDIDWVSVPSGIGNTLVEKEEGVGTPPSLPKDPLLVKTAPGDPLHRPRNDVTAFIRLPAATGA